MTDIRTRTGKIIERVLAAVVFSGFISLVVLTFSVIGR